MNFVDACKLLKKGRLVRRRAWKIRKVETSVANPSYLKPRTRHQFNQYIVVKMPHTEHIGHDERGFYWKTNLEREGGWVSTDYDPTMEDILANDWVEAK